ncbi:maturase K [Gossypium australe]|uniref:Maturase K n=1 Tax=Gossypium australe TaxID=47621 RepID=A0A5B6VPU2_9ROSI|nr:maturase K [Gossypium australe]
MGPHLNTDAISQIWSYTGSHVSMSMPYARYGLIRDHVSMSMPCPRHGLTRVLLSVSMPCPRHERAEFCLENKIRVFDELSCTPEECIECVVSLLRDNAYHWWKTLIYVVPREWVTWEFFQSKF